MSNYPPQDPPPHGYPPSAYPQNSQPPQSPPQGPPPAHPPIASQPPQGQPPQFQSPPNQPAYPPQPPSAPPAHPPFPPRPGQSHPQAQRPLQPQQFFQPPQSIPKALPVSPAQSPPQAQPAQAQPYPQAPAARAQPAQAQPVARAVPVQPAPVKPTVDSSKPAPSARSIPAPQAQTSPSAARPAAAAQAKKAARPVLVKKENEFQVADENNEDDSEESDVAAVAAKKAPPWMVSMVVHALLLIIMGLMALPRFFEEPVLLEVTYAEREGEQLLDDSLDMTALESLEITTPELALDLNPIENPLAAPPEVEMTLFDATNVTSAIEAPSIGMALSGREAGMKKALLAAYGGTASTEEAVKMGLEWLKRNQLRDGYWSLSGPYSDAALNDNRTAATAMALLAFQGAGHTHQKGEYQKEVAKAWDALLAQQDADGNFYRDGGGHNHRFYTQGQAMIAICELYGMTKDERFRQAAQKAVDYAVKTQATSGNPGGWRYYPGDDSDLSVTGWFVMGLQSAIMAGLEVPSPTLDKISKFLDSVQTDGGRGYGYVIGRPRTPAMSAEGLLCRQYLGWKHDDQRLVDGVAYLIKNPIDYRDQNVYYWYYATQVTHHMGGEPWDRWNEVMRQVVPAEQTKSGPERGSWDPSNDRWGSHGGRLFATCLSIYMLEVYYRHLPIYNHTLQ